MIRIVIADDHHLVRQGLRALLEKQPGLLIVGEAQDGDEALAAIEGMAPDVAILDINMPGKSGIEVTQCVQKLRSPTAVLILSMYSDESLIEQALVCGASGYLLKRSVAEELHDAVNSIYAGQLFISSLILDEHQFQWPHASDQLNRTNPISALTGRELEIMRLIASGSTNSAIAYQLAISAKTVEKHRSNLMRKMGVENLAGLITRGVKLGLISLEG
jgi:DNA-binding NarL/FixJ family response regulator